MGTLVEWPLEVERQFKLYAELARRRQRIGFSRLFGGAKGTGEVLARFDAKLDALGVAICCVED